MIIVLLGPPGVGKGTQAARIKKSFDVEVISAGDIIRDAIRSKKNQELQELVNKGLLVDDIIIFNLIKEKLEESENKNFLFDGYPRNINQAYTLNEYLYNSNKNIDVVLNLCLDTDLIVKRISGRFFCSKCNAIYNKYFKDTKVDRVCDNCGNTEFFTREDDNEETVKQRLFVYQDNFKDIISYYETKNILINIDTQYSEDFIYEKIKKHIILHV